MKLLALEFSLRDTGPRGQGAGGGRGESRKPVGRDECGTEEVTYELSLVE